MKSSLIPEKPVLFYPSLAATVGLDEAILLATLSDIVAHQPGQSSSGYYWHRINAAVLDEAMPFWDRRDVQRVSTSLREKGIIIISSAPLLQSGELKFAFNEKHSAHQASPAAQNPHLPAAPQGSGKNFIAHNWQPSQTTLDQLAQLSIPAEFAVQQVPEFVTYWRERNEAHRSWGQKFINHTVKRWRSFEERQHLKDRSQAITSDWTPMASSIKGLELRDIPRQFILDQVQEFITFWQATGERHVSWDSKFMQRVQALWADNEAKKNISKKEFAIFSHWRPSQDALEVMTTKSGIPLNFIQDAIPEFIIYWQDKGITSTTWNSLFIKHVRLQWHRYRHSLENSLEPQSIPKNWQPSRDVYDILALANIDQNFAKELIPEFVLYWQERNELHNSWSTRFLQHVKRTWAARHQLSASGSSQQPNGSRSTREISLEEELNDTSWAS